MSKTLQIPFHLGVWSVFIHMKEDMQLYSKVVAMVV